MAKKKNKKSRVVIVILIVLLLLLAALGCTYYMVANYFSSHFYPGTTVNGIEASLAETDYVKDAVRMEVEDYILAVHDKEDRVTYINAIDIAYRYADDGSIDQLMADQEPMKWISRIQLKHNYNIETYATYDEEKLLKLIEAMPCFDEANITMPQDAYFKQEDGDYEIVPEVEGNQPLKEQIFLDVKAAIDARKGSLTFGPEDYVQPKVRADDPSLLEKMAVVDKYKQMTITYDIEGYDQVLDGDTITSWITINEDMSVTVSDDMVESYAQQLASKYNTYAEVRSFRTTLGDTVEIGGGDYGWIVDKSGEAEQLKEDILKGESLHREPCWEQTAYVSGTDDIGDTYVELDYTNQHMYYYRGGSLVTESDFVSGNLNNGNGSPDGIFKIIDKKTDQTLEGEDYSSDVQYFMPFAYNVGLHDASWRSSFGGSIYKGGGSHGCINLPYSTAELLYNELDYGTPVVAYYRESVRLTSNNALVSNAYSYSY